MKLAAKTGNLILIRIRVSAREASLVRRWPPDAPGGCNCSEQLWLHARTFLVALENRLGWAGESNWRRTFPLLLLTTPPLWPPKHLQRLMKLGNIVWVETSRYLTKIMILWRKAARSKVLAAKHTASLQLLCTVGGNQARLGARTVAV